MLKFETKVSINSNASPQVIVDRLQQLVAPPRSFANAERIKPLRGRISVDGGFLRWAAGYRFTSPRTLHFKVLEMNGQAILVGTLRVWLGLRIPVLVWLACGVAFWSWTLIRDLIGHAAVHLIRHDLLFPLIGFAMAYGYVGMTVWVGRKRDRDLVKILRIVLSTENGAEVVGQLLSDSPNDKLSFEDPSPLHTGGQI